LWLTANLDINPPSDESISCELICKVAPTQFCFRPISFERLPVLLSPLLFELSLWSAHSHMLDLRNDWFSDALGRFSLVQSSLPARIVLESRDILVLCPFVAPTDKDSLDDPTVISRGACSTLALEMGTTRFAFHDQSTDKSVLLVSEHRDDAVVDVWSSQVAHTWSAGLQGINVVLFDDPACWNMWCSALSHAHALLPFNKSSRVSTVALPRVAVPAGPDVAWPDIGLVAPVSYTPSAAVWNMVKSSNAHLYHLVAVVPPFSFEAKSLHKPEFFSSLDDVKHESSADYQGNFSHIYCRIPEPQWSLHLTQRQYHQLRLAYACINTAHERMATLIEYHQHHPEAVSPSLWTVVADDVAPSDGSSQTSPLPDARLSTHEAQSIKMHFSFSSAQFSFLRVAEDTQQPMDTKEASRLAIFQYLAEVDVSATTVVWTTIADRHSLQISMSSLVCCWVNLLCPILVIFLFLFLLRKSSVMFAAIC
jgi:hypothetical protein